MGGELLIEASVNLPTGGRRRGLRRGDGGDAPLGGGEGSSGQGPQHLERPLDPDRRRVLLRRAQGAMRRKGAGLAAASPHCCTPRSSTSSPPPLPPRGGGTARAPSTGSGASARAGGRTRSSTCAGASGRAPTTSPPPRAACRTARSLQETWRAGWAGWRACCATRRAASASGLLTASCRRARRSRGARPGTGSGSQRAPPGGAAASCLACRLARGGGHTASHFFTAASDPLVACYKRWTFGDPAAAAGDGLAGDGGSLALWRRWRSIDLAGRSVPEAMRRALLEIEAEAVSAAERGGASEFSGSVARELELISSFAV